jgi:tetratricopeptide (TPR) repeat protein
MLCWHSPTDITSRPREVFSHAKRAAERALALNPKHAEAHLALAFTSYLSEYDWIGAEPRFRLVFALDPEFGYAHYVYSLYLHITGRQQEAVRECERALALDPLSPAGEALVGYILEPAGRTEEAERHFMAALELDPSFAFAHWYVLWMYLQRRQFRDAIAAGEQLASLSGRTIGLGQLAYAYAASGDQAAAQEIVEELIARQANGYISPFQIGIAVLGLGHTDDALDWFERAVDERDPGFLVNQHLNVFDGLRSDPRFVRLRERIGLGSAAA